MTQPVAVSGTKATTVTCATNRSVYSATTKTATVNGYKVSGSTVIRNYTGPGTYTASVVVSLSGPQLVAAGTVKNVQVTITSTGGTWNFSKTATGARAPKLAGKTIAGSIAYTCG